MAIGAGILGILQSFTDLNETKIALISLLLSTLLIAIPVLFYLRYSKISPSAALRLKRISIKSFIYIMILSIGIIILIDELDRIVYTLFGEPEYLESLADQLKITSLFSGIIIIATTLFVAPFIEEMLFRGYFQKVLEDSWRDVTKAILVTSLFFALVHLNPYWVVQIYLLGLVLSYLTWRTNSIWSGLILHGLNNGFAVALNNAQDIFNKYYNWHEHVNPLWIACAIIFVLLGFKFLNDDLERISHEKRNV